jgi:MerR family transcriptional regulator, light-induced transcriptional regulator
MNADQACQPRHPIRVVSQRTGLSSVMLRAWERRYHVVVPVRASSGQRLYSDADVERLRLLRLATRSGRSIGQVAGLANDVLADLIREDESERVGLRASRRAAEVRPEVSPHLEAAEAAVRALNSARLEAVLMRSLVVLSAETFIDEVAVPLLRFLGTSWAEGDLGVANEHMASAVMRRVLGYLAEAPDALSDAPTLVAAAPARQIHEFGALLVAAVAGTQRWRVVYLGADLPARDIAAAARQARARAVALSLVFPADDPFIGEELRAVRRGIGWEMELLVGGTAAAGYGLLVEEVGGRLLCGLPELRAALRELADSPAAGAGAAPT